MAQDGPKTGNPSVQTLEHTGLAWPEVSGKLEKLLFSTPDGAAVGGKPCAETQM